MINFKFAEKELQILKLSFDQHEKFYIQILRSEIKPEFLKLNVDIEKKHIEIKSEYLDEEYLDNIQILESYSNSGKRKIPDDFANKASNSNKSLKNHNGQSAPSNNNSYLKSPVTPQNSRHINKLRTPSNSKPQQNRLTPASNGDSGSYNARLTSSTSPLEQLSQRSRPKYDTSTIKQHSKVATSVHQKTLEIYDLIFEIIGSEHLAEDLSLYSYGLFPFLQNASMSQKPVALSIYETHYLPLTTKLKFCLKGLEEEGNEFFDRTLQILDTLGLSVGQGYFFQCLWLCIISVSHLRGAALAYLLKRLPKIDKSEGSIGESNIGEETKSLLLSAAKNLFATESSEIQELIKPYKVLISLLDKAEIGQLLLDNIFLDILTSLYTKCKLLDEDMRLEELKFIELSLIKSSQVEYILELCKYLLDIIPDNDLIQCFDVTKRKGIVQVDIAHHIFQEGELNFSDFFARVNDFYSENLFFDEHAHLDTRRESNISLNDGTPTSSSLLSPKEENFDQLVYFFQLGFNFTKYLDFKIKEITVFLSKKILQLPNKDIRNFSKSFEISNNIMRRVSLIFDPKSASLEITDDNTLAPAWVTGLIACSLCDNFSILNASLTTLLDIFSRSESSSLNLGIKTEEYIEKLVSRLWNYLSPNYLKLHLRAVQLIWKLCGIVQPYLVEEYLVRILSENVNSQLSNANITSITFNNFKGDSIKCNFDNFGVFWRISAVEESIGNPSLIFSRLLFIMFDTLQTSNVMTRKMGETWFRTNLKTYVRILDPLFSILLNSKIRFVRRKIQVVTSSPNFTKSEPILELLNSEKMNDAKTEKTDVHLNFLNSNANFGQILYCFETLNNLIKVGDGMLLKSLWLSLFNSDEIEIKWIFDEYGISIEKLTYAEVLVMISIRFIQAEMGNFFEHDISAEINYYKEQRTHRTKKTLDIMQATVAEFLNSVLLSSRGDYGLSITAMMVIQDVIIRQLLYCVSNGVTELQPRLLIVLKTILNTVANGRFQSTSSSIASNKTFSESTDSIKIPTAPMAAATPFSRYNINDSVPALNIKEKAESLQNPVMNVSSPLFVRTIIEALCFELNRPALQHWVDFILGSLSIFKVSLYQILFPLTRCITFEMGKFVNRFNFFLHSNGTGELQYDNSSMEMDFLVLTYALEKVLNFSLSLSSQENVLNATKDSNSFKVIADFMVNSLLRDSTDDLEKEIQQNNSKIREKLLDFLGEIIFIFGLILKAFDIKYESGIIKSSEKNISNDINENECFTCGVQEIKRRIEYRIRKFLETIYVNFSSDVIDSILEVWLLDQGEGERHSSAMQLFRLIGDCNEKVILVSVIDSLRNCQGNTRKAKRMSFKTVTIPELSLLKFLEWFYTNNSTDAVIETWPSLYTYIKECLVLVYSCKSIFPSLLRILICIFDNLLDSPVFEEKKFRRDAEDIFVKTLDYCILICGKAFDHGIWRRSIQTGEAEVAFEQNDLANDEYVKPLEYFEPKKGKDERNIIDCCAFIADKVISCIRKYNFDQDKMSTIFTNLVYYVITPYLKSKNKLQYTLALDCLNAMVKIPYSIKTWKKEVELNFNEVKFFQINEFSQISLWSNIINCLLNADREKITEIISKVTAVSSSSLFVSREAELLSRILNLRRLTFVVLSAPLDHYLQQLPSLQEKLVEIFKSTSSAMHVEAYFCLRVLLFKFSSQHLANLWPLVVTELIRLFVAILKKETKQQVSLEELQVFFAACKFLDLLFVLSVEEFQWHEWIFITDTLEGLNNLQTKKKPQPLPLIEKFISKLEINDLDENYAEKEDVKFSNSQTQTQNLKKRPLLTKKSIKDISELGYFIKNISSFNFKSNYNLVKADTSFIEKMLFLEILEEDNSNLGSE
ncbi:hypothetical protein HK099_001099 [Clydaea vesicula]|uniref:Uncharacterized protein n=1 Tax=Clydaea vesicula TaxID=447962 RepID=A0AAD5XZT8_9FUNG|nr:hypothetical protein HK099_001099 [Clydaea vesicula]